MRFLRKMCRPRSCPGQRPRQWLGRKREETRRNTSFLIFFHALVMVEFWGVHIFEVDITPGITGVSLDPSGPQLRKDADLFTSRAPFNMPSSSGQMAQEAGRRLQCFRWNLRIGCFFEWCFLCTFFAQYVWFSWFSIDFSDLSSSFG